MQHWRHFISLVVAVVINQGAAFAQTLTAAEEAKTSRAVLERSRQGRSQDLFVILDHSDLQARASRSQAEGASDATVLDEWKKGAAATRNFVFPGRRFLGAQVLEEWESSTTVLVRFTNHHSLEAILRHPKVIAVQERQSLPPALNQSLPLLQAPPWGLAGNDGKRDAEQHARSES